MSRSHPPQIEHILNRGVHWNKFQNNPLIHRFSESRKKHTLDPYRPTYHFVNPENMLNDPNGLSFWQGRWHLFYQAYPPDEFPDPKDIKKRRQHWGHAVSEDLVFWRDLPYAIYPGIETVCFFCSYRAISSVCRKANMVAIDSFRYDKYCYFSFYRSICNTEKIIIWRGYECLKPMGNLWAVLSCIM